MAEWASLTSEVLWQNGLSAIPIVGLSALATKCLPCRPATRHLMWLTVLAWFVVPPLLPAPPTPQLALLFAPQASNAPRDAAPDASTTTRMVDSGDADPSQTVLALIRLSVALAGKEGPSPVTATSPRTYNDDAALQPTEVVPTDELESTPPSPRSVARPATRRPDMLAQASDAGGPLSLGGSILPRRPAVVQPAADRPPSDPAELPGITNSKAELDDAPDEGQENKVVSLAPDPASDFPTPVAAGITTVQAPDAATVLRGLAASLAVSAGDAWRGLVDGMDAQAWTDGLKSVRDAVVTLPPMPTGIWIGGAAMLLLVTLGRVWRFQKHFASALPPPQSVLRMVASAAKDLDLVKAPRTLMVEGRVSPMIWCGLRPTLLIPALLWSQLDEPGKRAVLFHELAHVRRRDYLVNWIESLIGLIYWWHPLVWWVRRCLHAEAEVCCDAWVTTLLPRTRRAYAEALLLTQRYVDSTNRPTPALGIGVTTGRARRFARRLTMVMTGSTKPHLSVSGFAMVLAMATTGWLSSPASSCPDKDKERASAKPCDTPTPCPSARVESTGVAPRAATASSGIAVVAPTPSPVEGSTFEKHMAAKHALATSVAPAVVATPVPVIALASGPGRKDHDDDDGDDDDGRMDRMQKEMDRLNQKLDRLMDAMGDRHDAHDGPGHPTPPEPPSAPRAPRARRGPQPGQPAMPPMPPMPPMAPMPAMPRGMGVGPGMGMDFGPEGGEVFAKTYRLPKEKLEAFVRLMSRPDVPILVKPMDDAIEVNATRGQHRVFGAFLRMIDPGNDSVGEGPGFGGWEHGLGEDVHRHVEAEMKKHGKEIEKASREMKKAAREREKAEERRNKRRARAGSRMDQIRSQAAEKRQAEEELAREAESLGEQAEELSEQAQEIRERTDELTARAGSESEREARMVLERDALSLRHQVESIEQQREQIEEQARTVEDRARQAEDAANQAEERIQEIENELRELENNGDESGDDDEDGSHASADPDLDAAMWQVIPMNGDDDDSDADDDDVDDAVEAALQGAENGG